MNSILKGITPPRVVVLKKSLNGMYANITVDVFSAKEKKNKITSFSGCEILPDGRYRKDVSNRNIGLDYLYF